MLFISLHPHLLSSPHSYSSSFSHSSLQISSSSSSSLLPPSNHNNNNNNNNINNNNNNIIINNNNNNNNNTLPIPKDPIKAPTPPWMKAPLLLQPHHLIHFSKPLLKNKGRHVALPQDQHQKRQLYDDKALTGKEARGKKAMKKIANKVEKLHNTEKNNAQMGSDKGSSFEWYLEKLNENENEEEEEARARGRARERMPWEKDERTMILKMKKEKALTAAELNLDKVLLQRLRGEAARMRKWVKVMKAGVTQHVVDEIKRIWKGNELVMIKFDIPLCRNMDRAREIVETKTGGLVVWSKKDTLVVYRGCNYQLTSKGSPKIYIRSQRTSHSETNWVASVTKDDLYWAKSKHSTSDLPSLNADYKDSISTAIEDMNCQTVSGSLYERETDRLLDGLGPRFVDWWMHKPLPVDADLLPEVVPGYKPPFRLRPPYDSEKLADSELTYLRKLSHPLPTHFVLGRNTRLQGVAAAILKLWEKSLIAKIAIKYGVPNTDNETMANELKLLTGGVLLMRNKFYILLYRGKDFLPRKVAALVKERETELKSCQFHEETARMRAVEALPSIAEPSQETSTSGSFTEFKNIQTTIEGIKKVNGDSNIQLDAEIFRLEKELKEEQRKAFILDKKIERSAKELSKLNASWTPAEKDADLEVLTDEERETFRRIGLKMDSNLLLGRRGVFDGVLEGLHQHWKFREVVKVITMQRIFKRVIDTAKLLETESGGVLVSVEKLKEGHAIIIYRGKNYKRPSPKVSKNLLTKKTALRRSLEMQRIGSLKFFAHQRQQTISDLKLKLADLQQRKEIELGEF